MKIKSPCSVYVLRMFRSVSYVILVRHKDMIFTRVF